VSSAVSTDALSSGSTVATFTSAGNVGIGTTSPSGLLHVANTGTAGTTADNLNTYFSSTNRNSTVYILAKNTEGSNLYFGDADSNTVGGLVYDHTGNYLRVDVNGSERARIDSSGTFTVKGIGTAAFSVNGAAPNNSLIIDSSGRALVGTSSSRSVGAQYGSSGQSLSTDSFPLQIEGNSAVGASFICNRDADAFGPYLVFGRSRTASSGGVGLVASGDNLGSISFNGADGGDLQCIAAAIRCDVDGTPGANDMPGRLVFSTTADGASSPTERMRIRSDGTIRAGQNGGDFEIGREYVDAGSLNTRGSIALYAVGGASNNEYYAYLYASSGATQPSDSSLRVSVKHWDGSNYVNREVFYVLNNGNGVFVGTVTANGVVLTSDRTLKNNIEDANLDNQWSDIKAIKLRNYTWKDNPEYGRFIGVVAQELEEISPGLITKEFDDEGEEIPGSCKVKFDALQMKMLGALQQALQRIETLEAEVAALKNA
jgi:hypothetical protein